MTKGHQLVCRVCGTRFPAPRCDAITCSSTCRQRLRRGHAFAYFTGLSKREQRAERRIHEGQDRWRAAVKNSKEATRAYRALKRKHREEEREEKREEKREREYYEAVGINYLIDQEEATARMAMIMITGALSLFTHEQRNDMSAEAIAAFLDSDRVRNPRLPKLSVDYVVALLDYLRERGDYDRIIAEARAKMGPQAATF